MSFQRARTPEQRERRRQAILATAHQMLMEMPVSQISLNELSRRTGLAKSNVLRYFESREEVLLELLDAAVAEWTADLQNVVEVESANGTSLYSRVEFVSHAVASTLASRPSLCDLLYAESGVLARNVSVEVVLRHKHATQEMASKVERVLKLVVPELEGHDVTDVVIALLLVAAAAWPYAQPGEVLKAAYGRDASVQAMHRDFVPLVERTLVLTIRGLVAETEDR